ncbi:hypothetical protein BWI15_30970 [Kribbella sp. ALI-6-A]|nr:hypothetical protein BWI15_30970 [Kribbella sp. ALI-6-A]
MAAEDALLGHHLRRGFDGDIAVWRLGTGLTDGLMESENLSLLSTALGEPIGGVVTRSRALVENKLEQVVTVAAAIHASPSWRLDHAEVLSVL